MKFLDLLSYSLLIAGLVLASVTFLRFSFDSTMQMYIIFAVVIFYLVWGLVYHFAKGDLNKKLAAEYLLLGAICSLVGVLVFWL